MKLDSYDRKLLELIQNNSRIPTDLLAERVNLSVSAVQRRLKKLRDEGVIASEIAIIDPAYTAAPMRFIAGLEIDRDNYQTLALLKKWAQARVDIQQLHYVTGNVDVVLVLCAETVAKYDRIIEQLMAEVPNIRRVTTNVVLDSPKLSFYTPLAAEQE